MKKKTTVNELKKKKLPKKFKKSKELQIKVVLF